jgi:hypothetical protein
LHGVLLRRAEFTTCSPTTETRTPVLTITSDEAICETDT